MLFINEKTVSEHLNWGEVFSAIELAMVSVSKKRAVQNPRSVTKIPESQNLLFTMPGYLEDCSGEDLSAIGCKMVTSFPKNNEKCGLPSIMANILLFDETTGSLQAVIEATEITSWRTAAASAVATKCLRKNKEQTKVLAIVGAGVQARIHAIAFQHFFKFDKIYIWSKTPSRARDLKNLLETSIEGDFFTSVSVEDCVRNADVIITATFSNRPLLKYKWLKKGFHINAVGAGNDVSEVDIETYKNSKVYIDHLSGAEVELKHLLGDGIKFQAEIGSVVEGSEEVPQANENTIFQSLGMAAEDCVIAKLIYKKVTKLQ